jgi:sacsin
LEFLITSKDITGCGASSTLLIFNNERGFSATNIESICRVGKSTKKGNRHQGYIGEKGKYSQLFSFILFPSPFRKKKYTSMEIKLVRTF